MDADIRQYPRSVETTLDTALADTPVVALLGPRQSGKSTLVRTLAPDRAYFSLDDEQLLRTAQDDPGGFIASLPTLATIDEIQRAPELLRAIKLAIDQDRRPGRFLVTGSAHLLLLPRVGDSLAGRMEVVRLHPVTESEKERQPGAFLADLISGRLAPRLSATRAESGKDLLARLLAGGFPPAFTRPEGRARQWHRQYVSALVERDVRDIAQVRDAHEVGRLLEVVALRSAQLLNVHALSMDLGLDRTTIEHYLAILDRLYLTRRLPAWHRNAAKRLVKAPKIYIADSGLAATLATVHAVDWIGNRDRVGPILESFVVQQLIAQASWTDPDLRFWHYRDKDQIEVDVVITRGPQTWGVEVKAGSTASAADGKGLRRLAERCGADFVGGVVLYTGAHAVALGDERILAVPVAELWSR